MAQLASDDVAVEVRGLEKSYGGLQAVCGIDLEIRRGEVFALLGPNGAGKTTTVEILEGYRRRDSGHVAVLGIDPGRQRAQLKPRIGIVLQSTGVDRYLTVAETVAMYAGFYPSPDRSTRSSRSSGWRRSGTPVSSSSRGVNSAASTLRSPSRGTRICSSSTSPRPALTPQRGARPGRW